MNLNRWILQEARQFVIEHKGVFEKSIIAYASAFPEPTIENTTNHNTHILITLKDKFLEYEDNPNRKKLFEAAWKIFIIEYEHDPYYRARFDFIIEEIIKSDWMPRRLGHPVSHWREPEPYGGDGGNKVLKYIDLTYR